MDSLGASADGQADELPLRAALRDAIDALYPGEGANVLPPPEVETRCGACGQLLTPAAKRWMLSDDPDADPPAPPDLIPGAIYRELSRAHEDAAGLVVRARRMDSPLLRDLDELLENFTVAMSALSEYRGHFTESASL